MKKLLIILALLVIFPATTYAEISPENQQKLEKALNYLYKEQNFTGGYGGSGVAEPKAPVEPLPIVQDSFWQKVGLKGIIASLGILLVTIGAFIGYKVHRIEKWAKRNL